MLPCFLAVSIYFTVLIVFILFHNLKYECMQYTSVHVWSTYLPNSMGKTNGDRKDFKVGTNILESDARRYKDDRYDRKSTLKSILWLPHPTSTIFNTLYIIKIYCAYSDMFLICQVSRVCALGWDACFQVTHSTQFI